MMARSDRDSSSGQPQVLSADELREQPTALAPRVIITEQTGRVVTAAAIVPSAPTELVPLRPQRRLLKIGLAGLGAAFVGWLGVDLTVWIEQAFTHGVVIGSLALVSAAAGIAGAGLVIAREVRSFLALRSVEANQRRIARAFAVARPADTHALIRDVLAVVPKDRESQAAIAAFQQQVQRHHTPSQQLELLSQTVMTTFDRRAEAIVRRSSVRAFGITAISPTAVTDALFFIACSVRMVREIAVCYGHRPTMSATLHLLRRLMIEGGKLGAIDLAAASLTQHIAGAVAERIAAGAAESTYAAQRMARLGLVTMGLCRPIPFQPNEVPGIMSSLIGNMLTPAVRAKIEDGDED
jgi:putative membrane protein